MAVVFRRAEPARRLGPPAAPRLPRRTPARSIVLRLRGCRLGSHGAREIVERHLSVVGDELRDRALVGHLLEALGLLAIIECARHGDLTRMSVRLLLE
jgi:hypothetical protein